MTTQSTADSSARAWVEIDLGALVRNGEALARHARVPLMPMATVAEGAELRAAGIARRILIFTPLLAGDFAAARAAKLTPTLGDASTIAAWIESGGGDWHLAIETGMNRAGVRWDAIGTVADLVRRAPPAGAFTHFHSAELDDGSMDEQERRFGDALAALPARPALLHTENSPALTRRHPSPWSFARPGVFLYGVGCGPRALLAPEPVVAVRARIVELHDALAGESASYDATWRAARPSRVATLAIGYADGYRRSLGNAGTVLVHGARASVAGTVTMDMTMVDVTGLPCAVGDAATLIGTDGGESITVEDVATACRLSPYEILTGLRQRLSRRYG